MSNLASSTRTVPLFEVKKDTNQVAEIGPTTFPELKLWERKDLEAWVLSSPELAGGDFTSRDIGVRSL